MPPGIMHMINRTTVLATCVVLAGSCAAWSEEKLTTEQVELCGEDAARFCAALEGIPNARACLLRRIKKVAPSCAYLLKRKEPIATLIREGARGLGERTITGARPSGEDPWPR